MHAAAYSGNVAGLQLVLDQGAEVNSVDHCGCSALMVAADYGQTRAVGMWFTIPAFIVISLWVILPSYSKETLKHIKTTFISGRGPNIVLRCLREESFPSFRRFVFFVSTLSLTNVYL